MKDLRSLALAATPGPWTHVAVRHMQHEVFTADDDRPHTEGQATICCWHASDAAFIAACSPQAVLALCDEIDRLRAERDEAADRADRWHAKWERDTATLRETLTAEIEHERTKTGAARAECERWRECARSLGRVYQPEDLVTVAVGLDETRAECERLRGVYEAALVWHQCAKSDAGLNGACGRHDDRLYAAIDAARGDK